MQSGEPGYSIAFILALWVFLGPAPWEAPSPWPFEKFKGGSVLPLCLTGGAGPSHTLLHCTVLSMQLLLQRLIPGPVLSQPLSSEPVGGGGVDPASTGVGWVAAAAVCGFLLTAWLSGLWCGLASVFRERARKELPHPGSNDLSTADDLSVDQSESLVMWGQ